MEIVYKKLTAAELETFIQMRIEQLREEGAPENDQEVLAKGYDLPTTQSDIDKAKKETEDLLDCIESMYLPYLYDEIPIPEDVQENMADALANKGYLVRTGEIYSNIKHAEKLERFLEDAKDSKKGSVVLYELGARGAVSRYEYSFDGIDMYVFASGMEIKPNGTKCQTYCSYTRIKTWRYTDAGWFCYVLCVPEYPEVSEIVDGSVLIRVKPISEENKRAIIIKQIKNIDDAKDYLSKEGRESGLINNTLDNTSTFAKI